MQGTKREEHPAARVVGLEVDRLALRLERPLAISFHALAWQECFFVRLLDEQGNLGWGEGAPLEAITGDTLEGALSEAATLRPADMPPLTLAERFHDEYIRGLGSSTLRAALDLAAHDLAARRKGVPVYRLYSERPALRPNSVTVFLQESPRASFRETRRLLEAHPHARILKIKLRGEGDLQRCLAIREAAPEGLRFILDANQGFSDPELAVAEISRIAEHLGDVLLVEEPCPKGDLERMAAVRRHLRGVRVFADESCVDEADLQRIVQARCADGVNIKLQKAGGIAPARRMAARAAEAGLEVMLGAMFETPLAHSAGVHFTVSTPNVILSDLDMDLDLPVFFRGRTPFRDGFRTPLPDSGFGFSLDPARVAELRAQGVLRLEAAVRR